MIWEQRGSDAYAQVGDCVHRVSFSFQNQGWRLAYRVDGDTGWTTVGYFATPQDAKGAAR